MLMKYKCCFCGMLYDWYQEVCENPNYSETEARTAKTLNKTYHEKSGVYVTANSIVFKSFLPSPDKAGEEQEVQEAGGNLDGMIINLCPGCMRELLTRCNPLGIGVHNCFHI